jgi:hypothetical protein
VSFKEEYIVFFVLELLTYNHASYENFGFHVRVGICGGLRAS